MDSRHQHLNSCFLFFNNIRCYLFPYFIFLLPAISSVSVSRSLSSSIKSLGFFPTTVIMRNLALLGLSLRIRQRWNIVLQDVINPICVQSSSKPGPTAVPKSTAPVVGTTIPEFGNVTEVSSEHVTIGVILPVAFNYESLFISTSSLTRMLNP